MKLALWASALLALGFLSGGCSDKDDRATEEKLYAPAPELASRNVMACPKCGRRMKVVAFLTDYAVVDRIMEHLKLIFVAEKPPPSHVFTEVALMTAASACTHGDL